jgi:hypothetical protein
LVRLDYQVGLLVPGVGQILLNQSSITGLGSSSRVKGSPVR